MRGATRREPGGKNPRAPESERFTYTESRLDSGVSGVPLVAHSPPACRRHACASDSLPLGGSSVRSEAWGRVKVVT